MNETTKKKRLSATLAPYSQWVSLLLLSSLAHADPLPPRFVDIAADLGITVHETDLDLFDSYTADEIFLSSTSLCICPVRSIDSRRPAQEGIPGPVTRRLMDGYKTLLDYDFEQQYLQFLD